MHTTTDVEKQDQGVPPFRKERRIVRKKGWREREVQIPKRLKFFVKFPDICLRNICTDSLPITQVYLVKGPLVYQYTGNYLSKEFQSLTLYRSLKIKEEDKRSFNEMQYSSILPDKTSLSTHILDTYRNLK